MSRQAADPSNPPSGKPSGARRWFEFLLHLYPADFRDEMGAALVDAYVDRCRTMRARAGRLGVAVVCARATVDSLVNGVAERLRPGVSWRRTGNWGQDAERAVRRLIRAPVFSLAMIGTLTIGLGAFAVVLTVIAKVLVEPPAYERPDDLYYAWRDYRAFFNLDRGWLGGPDVSDIAKAGGPIVDAAGIRISRQTLGDAGASDAAPEEIAVMVSTPNLFDVLGVRPLVGRTFAPNESGDGRPGVVVLGHDFWRRRYGGDSGVVGRAIRLNGATFTVIGVMPRQFHFVRHSSLGPPEGADAYITFPFQMADLNPNGGSFAGLIRARPGSTPAQVNAAVVAVGQSLDERFFKKKGLKLYAVGMRPDLVAPIRPALLVLGLSGAFLVLVLTVNLATLLLARAVERDREFAVSRALGANPLALVRAILFEATLLGSAGGAAAAVAAVWGTRVLVALAPLDLPRRESVAVDWKVGLAVIAVGALLGLAAGIAPAFMASRSSLASLLRAVAVRGSGHGRLRRSLVVVQVALCVVLLSTGALVARSFERLLRSQPGFSPANVLTFRVPVAHWRFSDNASAVAFDDRLEAELRALPGVISVGAASAVPLTAGLDQTDVKLPGAPGNTGESEHDAPLVDTPFARAGWFATMGIRVLAGRDFGPVLPGARREAIIDRTLAAEFYPAGNAIGASAVLGRDTAIIVGVVDHARQYDLHKDGRSQVYLRDQDDTYGPLYFAIRTRRDPIGLADDVHAAVRRVDSQMAISEVRTMDAVVNDSLREQRVSAVLVAGFSIGALLLAAMGLWGVVAGSVARRRSEIAIRLALGADRGRVLRLVLGEGAVLVGLGVVLAIPGVYIAGQVLRGLLIGISPFDPLTLGLVALGLMAVALGACYVPARRVGHIDPAGALRES